MTDEQIIKAYERCFTLGFDESTCYECPFYTATANCTEDLRDSTLDLINRQKTDIERLKDELHRAKVEISKHFDYMDEATNESLDVFADSLKIKLNRTIGNLVKEMTEENEK